MSDDYDKQRDIEAEGQRAAIYHREGRSTLLRVTRILEEIRGVQYGVGEWEFGFLLSMQEKHPEVLTERQEKVLAGLERKVFGGGDE